MLLTPPTWLVMPVDKIKRDFMWNVEDKAPRDKCFIHRTYMLKPKNCGRLAITDIVRQSRALCLHPLWLAWNYTYVQALAGARHTTGQGCKRHLHVVHHDSPPPPYMQRRVLKLRELWDKLMRFITPNPSIELLRQACELWDRKLCISFHDRANDRIS